MDAHDRENIENDRKLLDDVRATLNTLRFSGKVPEDMCRAVEGMANVLTRILLREAGIQARD